MEKNADVLLSLHYRTMYGGMKGDMIMLKNAIEYYKTEQVYSIITPHIDLPQEVELLMEAIDFHPLPPLLSALHKKTGLEKSLIKEMIWYAESGVNVRKQETLDQSEEYQEKEEWGLISNHIDTIRMELI
jgi:hypothetical protein